MGSYSSAPMGQENWQEISTKTHDELGKHGKYAVIQAGIISSYQLFFLPASVFSLLL